jgi:hypothetical protein
MFLPRTLTEVSSVDASAGRDYAPDKREDVRKFLEQAGRDYAPDKREDVRKFLERAWRWAESNKLVEPATGRNGHNGWKYLTDEGTAVARGQAITAQDEWITAAEASRLLKPVFNGEHMARRTICKRAHNGLIRARAAQFMDDNESKDNYEVPREFWWAEGAAALEQNWITGDFETWIREQVHLRAFGVSFLRDDIEKMLPPDTVESVELKKKAATGNTVFIGHGGSTIWLELKEFLRDRLHLSVDEFNSVPVAGVPTAVRLEELLDRAGFAFLVMTAEDEQSDGTIRARENVVHEAGLFQGRLGFRKGIILMEDSCKPFSNIDGLGQIRFPKGKINAGFEEIRRVLEREGLIAAP